jgi:hypothetical protein
VGRWETYPFGGVLVLSMLSFFTPGGDLPEGPDISDKIEHAAIFLGLAVTGRLAGFRPGRLLAGLFGYAIVSEVLQWLLPIDRDGDWLDVLADTAGLLTGLAGVALLTRFGGVVARGRGRGSR